MGKIGVNAPIPVFVGVGQGVLRSLQGLGSRDIIKETAPEVKERERLRQEKESG
ncbi:MAG: hypothetical protein ABIK20_07200 [Candidatus Omnitrophota bacterium]|nr:hypothetical protein [Candidatus Omnitrophota bacterium]